VTFQRDLLASKIPVTIITGFLGAGKTTLVSKLIQHPDMNRVAVVINELGEIGIDNDLVSMSSENISLLSNGCICCSVRTDMQETMRELFAKRMVGEIPEFDRIIIETTGLADPAPILQTLLSDALFEAQFRLDGLVTLVDGFNGLMQIEQQMETCKQIAVADLILITKSDLLESSGKQALELAIRSLNPQAPMLFVLNGEIEPKRLMNLGLASSRSVEKTLGFLGSLLNSNNESTDIYLGDFAKRHNQGIKTLSLRFHDPFSWEAASAALELLTSLRGSDMLRVKGIMNIDGKPVVIQGVQHIFHPPVTLDEWPTDDHDTRMVFITKNMEAELIKSLFNAVGAITQNSESIKETN
jgi:G3E family GTPase